jgi:hypothetical protein
LDFVKRFAKYLNVILLWLAAAGMVGHLVIIHDHHPDTDFFAGKDHCPVSDKAPEHHSHHPIHCHAFNHVAGEKAVTFRIDRPATSLLAELPVVIDVCITLPVVKTVAVDYPIRIPLTRLAGNIPLRAPPVAS